MHIPAVTTEAIAPSRLLRQLQETAREVVPETTASVEVRLSPDAQLANLLDTLVGGDGGLDAGLVARLLGESALFNDNGSFTVDPAQVFPLPAGLVTDPETGDPLSLPEIGRNGFDPERLSTLLQQSPELLPLVQASITSAGLETLFDRAADDTSGIPPSIQLYLDNGGVAGVRLDPAEGAGVTPLNPLP